MIRTTLLILALSATGSHAQDAPGAANAGQSDEDRAAALDAAADVGVTGFVPLVAPALGAAAAAIGVAAAGGGGGSANSTTSTVSTN